jgi:hypothetical protein
MGRLMAGKPGRSGRKRQGAEPKVYFNSRIDPELRDELQVAADARGRSLSSEIEERLKNSLVPAGKVDEATRALCLLIMEAAKQTADDNRNWTNDANLRAAFNGAVSLIIAMVSAAGRSKIEETIGEPFKHPAFTRPGDLARAVVLRIGNDLIESQNEPQSRAFRALGNPAKWLKHIRRHWEQADAFEKTTPVFLQMNEKEIRETLAELKGEEYQPESVTISLLNRLADLAGKKGGSK